MGSIVFISVGVGAACAWIRRWWFQAVALLVCGLFSASRTMNSRLAANDTAWADAEAGLRAFPVSDGGANAMVALLGWLPGVLVAVAVWWGLAQVFQRFVRGPREA